jgi:hypothetical protein
MDDNDDSLVLEHLAKWCKLGEACRIKRYFGYRTLGQGPLGSHPAVVIDSGGGVDMPNVQQVTIEIFDRGVDPKYHQIRFRCVATTDDGKTAAGKPAATLEEALIIVHWQELD